jgi:hypothetical protein
MVLRAVYTLQNNQLDLYHTRLVVVKATAVNVANTATVDPTDYWPIYIFMHKIRYVTAPSWRKVT